MKHEKALVKKLFFTLLFLLGLHTSVVAQNTAVVEDFESIPVFQNDTAGVQGKFGSWRFIRSNVAVITDGVEGTGAHAALLGANKPSLVLESSPNTVGYVSFTIYNNSNSLAKFVLSAKAPNSSTWTEQTDVADVKSNSISPKTKITITYEKEFVAGTSLRFNLTSGSNCYIDDITFADAAPDPLYDPEEFVADPDITSSPYWGYWMDNNISDLSGLGTGVPTSFVAIFVPGDALLKGAQIRGVRVPVKDASVINSIHVWCTKTLTDATTFDRKAKLSTISNGINQVAFDEPFDLPVEGCYIGYSITAKAVNSDAAKYPITTTSTDHSNGLYLYLNGKWEDFSNQSYGCSALQASLNVGFAQPDYFATFGTIENPMTEVNTTTTWRIPVLSDGHKSVSNIDYTIDVNGQVESRNAKVNIPAGFSKVGYVNVNVTSPAEEGNYSVKLSISKINGQPNAVASQVTDLSFTNLERFVRRNVVVEENTGTGCGYCPYGLQGMANMRNAHPDRFIGLAIHKFNSTDPMYPQYASIASLGITSAPSLAMDRQEVLHAYVGSGSGRNILKDFEDHMNVPAEVDIKLDAKWTDDSKTAVQLNVNTEAVFDGRYQIVYALVADSLTAKNSRWMQQNYLAGDPASAYPADLAKFCSGGIYGQSAFYYPFDDVVIASSYNGAQINQAPALGLLNARQSVATSYTLTLPESDTYLLKSAVRASIDKVYAIAFVLNAKGQVAQGVKVHVVEVAGSEEGIHAVQNDQPAADAPAYDLQGRQISAPRAGQLIIRNGEKRIVTSL